jgi:phage-related protein
MTWSITYHNKDVEAFVLGLPDGLLARYLRLADMMHEFGANLDMTHTRAMGEGLFEWRVKSKEGIARVFFRAVIGQRVVMLYCFIKKSEKTPPKELKLARLRLSEVKRS